MRRNTIQAKGFKLSSVKKAHLKHNFSYKTSRNEEGVRMDDIKIDTMRNFLCLGSIIQDDKELVENITNRLKAGWVKQRGAYRFFMRS